MGQACSACIPESAARPHRPWISTQTLELIELRNNARRCSHYELELALNKRIKLGAKDDRRNWLNEQLENGDWSAIRKLRRVEARHPGRLQDLSGNLVESADRAETFAEYYEKVQWSCASSDESSMPTILQSQQGSSVNVSVGNFSKKELRTVLQKLGKGKACGPDGVPAEMWIALADDDGALQHLMTLCQKAWAVKCIPESWSSATVVALFKSGSTALPQNYRPISLLSVGYKVLARLVLNRLRASDVEEKLPAGLVEGFRQSPSSRNVACFAGVWGAGRVCRNGCSHIPQKDVLCQRWWVHIFCAWPGYRHSTRLPSVTIPFHHCAYCHFRTGGQSLDE